MNDAAVKTGLRTRKAEGIDFVTCRICDRRLQSISWSHLVYRHDYDPDDALLKYARTFGVRTLRCESVKARNIKSLNSWFARQGRNWTRARVKREIQALAKEGAPLSSWRVRGDHKDLFEAASRLYGAWSKALAASGLDPEAVRARKSWREKEIRKRLVALQRKGIPLDWTSVRKADKSLAIVCRSRWGGWSHALKALGLKPISRYQFWTKKEILRTIKARWNSGQKLNVTALRPKHRSLVRAARSRFGSWEKALAAAGIPPKEVVKRREWWTRKQVISEIRRLGRWISSTEAQVVDSSLFKAASNHCGGWYAALEEARPKQPDQPRRLERSAAKGP